MAFHELATNATKYGALSVEAGRVALRWEVEPGMPQHLVLCWQEEGGPEVVAPTRKGFGTRLIERGLARELGGDVNLVYEPTGVICKLDVPLVGSTAMDMKNTH